VFVFIGIGMFLEASVNGITAVNRWLFAIAGSEGMRLADGATAIIGGVGGLGGGGIVNLSSLFTPALILHQ
jgi:hypothetical protein